MSRLQHFLKRALLVVGFVAAGAASAGQSLWALPDEFVDEFGVKAQLSHWAGPKTIVSMEYTACKFVCGVNWRRLVDIQAEADKHKMDVKFLVISLDPKNDTPAEWRDYRKVRDLKRDNWTFVTGSRAATDKVVALLGVKWWVFNDSIMHDFKLVRIEKDGRAAATMVTFDDPAYEFLTR